jgi:hypothetical protein
VEAKKPRRLHRIMFSKMFTLGIALPPIVIILGIVASEVVTYLAYFKILDWPLSPRPGGEGILEEAFLRQWSIGAILVAQGVLMEGRETVYHRTRVEEGFGPLLGQDQCNALSEVQGFMVLTVGLILELFIEATKLFHMRSDLALVIAGGVALVLDALAVGLLLYHAYLVIRLPMSTEELEPEPSAQE